MRGAAGLAVALAVLAVAPPAAGASAGSPDPTFGTGGVVVGAAGSAAAVAVEPGGRILVGGESYDGRGGHPLTLTAHTVWGGLDTSFGRLGVATAPATGLAGVATAPGGQVVAVGYRLRGGRREPAVARFSAAGVLEGVGGDAVGDGDALPRSLVLAPDGSALVACDAVRGGEPVVAVVRYGSDGARDPRFGTAFVALPGRAVTAAGMAVGASGAVTVAGTAYDPIDGSAQPLVARLLPAGTLDPGFAGGAPVVVDTRLEGVQARALALDSDGGVTVAASGRAPLRSEFVAVRVTAAGAPDPSFGTSGVAAVPVGTGDAFAAAVAVDPAGGAVLAGQAVTGATAQTALIRLGPDGAIDPAFAPAGPPLVPAAGLDSRPAALALDPMGRIVAAGFSAAGGLPQITLARYEGG